MIYYLTPHLWNRLSPTLRVSYQFDPSSSPSSSPSAYSDLGPLLLTFLVAFTAGVSSIFYLGLTFDLWLAGCLLLLADRPGDMRLPSVGSPVGHCHQSWSAGLERS